MAQWYRQGLAKALNKEVDWDSDTFRLTLHTVTYAPNLDTHAYVSDLTNELATGGGYTAGGIALTMSPPAYTAANSWGTSRAASTAYVSGDIVRPSTGNGFLYQAIVAGTTAATAPTWPTVLGQTVTDGSVTWANVGAGIITLGASNVSVASFTAGPFRYGVISDRTPATAATQPLVALLDFGANQTGSGGPFTITWSVQGVLQLLMP